MGCLAGDAWIRSDTLAAVTIERARSLANIPTPKGWDDLDEEEVACCPFCRSPFTLDARNRSGDQNRVFCSTACKAAAYTETRRKRRTAGRERACLTCGAAIPPEVDGHRRYCDDCSEHVRAQRAAA